MQLNIPMLSILAVGCSTFISASSYATSAKSDGAPVPRTYCALASDPAQEEIQHLCSSAPPADDRSWVLPVSTETSTRWIELHLRESFAFERLEIDLGCSIFKTPNTSHEIDFTATFENGIALTGKLDFAPDIQTIYLPGWSQSRSIRFDFSAQQPEICLSSLKAIAIDAAAIDDIPYLECWSAGGLLNESCHAAEILRLQNEKDAYLKGASQTIRQIFDDWQSIADDYCRQLDSGQQHECKRERLLDMLWAARTHISSTRISKTQPAIEANQD